MLPIHTERLLLRPFTEDDAEAYFPVMSNPQVLRYTGDTPFESIEQLRRMLQERTLRDYAVYGFGRMACIEKASGRLIGFSGMKYVEELQEVDVGYRFLPDCWGKGYATESARPLMRDCVEKHQLKRVIGLVDPANHASANVLQKLGLHFEKHFNPEWHASGLDLYAVATDAVATGEATSDAA